MKLPDEPYDLDAEIAKYGGRVSLQRTPVGHQIEVATRATADPTTPSPYDLDAEIAKYGGQSSPRPAPLAALDQVDPSLRSEVEAFAGILGASVDLVVPRGVPDPRLAGGMSRPRWSTPRPPAKSCRPGWSSSAKFNMVGPSGCVGEVRHAPTRRNTGVSTKTGELIGSSS